jgi:hypothetical protein
MAQSLGRSLLLCSVVALGCSGGGGSDGDGSAGYAVTSATAWNGRQSVKTGPLPGGRYNLAVTCYNVTAYCEPLLNAFGYED